MENFSLPLMSFLEKKTFILSNYKTQFFFFLSRNIPIYTLISVLKQENITFLDSVNEMGKTYPAPIHTCANPPHSTTSERCGAVFKNLNPQNHKSN